MKFLPVLSCCLALMGTAQAASGQRVTLRGKLMYASTPKPYFYVDTTNTLLTSGTIDVVGFASHQVSLAGEWNGAMDKPSVEVGRIEVVRPSFAIGEKRAIGGDVSFSLYGTPGETAVLAVCPGCTFLPLPGYGTLFLDPLELIVIGSGRIGPTGRIEVAVPIPYEPKLIGLTVYGQGVSLGGYSQPSTTNPDRMTISR